MFKKENKMKDLNNEEQATPDNWDHLDKDDKNLKVCLETNLLIRQQLITCQKEKAQTQTNLDICRKEKIQTQTNLDICKDEHKNTKEALKKCQEERTGNLEELELTRAALEICRNDNSVTKRELSLCQTEHGNTKKLLDKCVIDHKTTKNELKQSQKDLEKTQQDLAISSKNLITCESNLKLCRSNSRIVEIENERFKGKFEGYKKTVGKFSSDVKELIGMVTPILDRLSEDEMPVGIYKTLGKVQAFLETASHEILKDFAVENNTLINQNEPLEDSDNVIL